MKPLESPYKTGQLPRRWWHHFLGTAWLKYFNCLKEQLESRGPVPDSVWPSEEQVRIAHKIEDILAEICWGEKLSFHPEDPYYVVGEFEVGDLSEVEAVMAIEELFEVKIPKDWGATNIALFFGQVVEYIEKETANKITDSDDASASTKS